MQSNSILTRGGVLTAAVLLGTIAANATTTAPRHAARPASSVKTDASTPKPATEQVLIEGGTLAANYDGNLADIVARPITCTSIPGDDRDCAAESSIPTAPASNTIQYIYAAVGTGGAQLDFVNQQSGSAGKTASTYPEFADTLDSYSNVSPIGFTKGWAGTASSSVAEDTIHAAAGDAPIPLGPAEGSEFVPAGFSIYTDSLAAYNGGGDTSGAGFNSNRGPAKVVPVIGTGISIIFNTTGLTLNSNNSLNLTQDDLCGIFTGTITNWSQTSANPGSQAITIIHRSDGSGSTFLTAYDLSNMCGAQNPISASLGGKPTAAHYWNQHGFTQGVGTDSSVLTSSGTVVTDSTAPEVAWPNNSVGAAKTGGVISAVAATTGAVGYVSPSNTLGANTAEAYVENYKGAYEQATATTVAASLSGTTTTDPTPPGYPADNKTTTLYFPFPTAAAGDALVGYSYGYFYTCYPTRDKDQATGIKDLFGYETGSKTAATAATVAAFWNLNALGTAQAKILTSALSFKTAPVTKATKYLSPVNGASLTYTCTDT